MRRAIALDIVRSDIILWTLRAFEPTPDYLGRRGWKSDIAALTSMWLALIPAEQIGRQLDRTTAAVTQQAWIQHLPRRQSNSNYIRLRS